MQIEFFGGTLVLVLYANKSRLQYDKIGNNVSYFEFKGSHAMNDAQWMKSRNG
jgi:hypothetical protein